VSIATLKLGAGILIVCLVLDVRHDMGCKLAMESSKWTLIILEDVASSLRHLYTLTETLTSTIALMRSCVLLTAQGESDNTGLCRYHCRLVLFGSSPHRQRKAAQILCGTREVVGVERGNAACKAADP